jgi:hypothetical protein
MSTSLQFPLDIEDDWPPFGSESLPFDINGKGFRLLTPPLFVKDLSVDDVILVERDQNRFVSSWHHQFRSDRTTIWLLRLRNNNFVDERLSILRKMGCNTVGLESVGCYAVDVPGSIDIGDIDDVLSELDPDEVAIAYPSMRHEE